MCPLEPVAKRHGHARFPAAAYDNSRDAQMTISNDPSGAGGLRTPTGTDKNNIDRRSGQSVRSRLRAPTCNAYSNYCNCCGHSGNVVDQVPSDSVWSVVPVRRRRSRRIRGAVVNDVVHESLGNFVDDAVVANHLGQFSQIGAQDAEYVNETHENEMESSHMFSPTGSVMSLSDHESDEDIHDNACA